MREFVDAIFEFIAAASLSDEEFALISIEEEELTLALYTELEAIIDSRELVSNTRDRLGFYFQAAGVEIVASSEGQSNILIGGALCS